MKKKTTLITLVAIHLIALLTIDSCTSSVKSSKATDTNYQSQGYTEATIINYTVDGCSYLLQLTDGKKLEPVNLKDEFKKDHLIVWIKYQPYTGNSICMAGEMIILTDIKKKE